MNPERTASPLEEELGLSFYVKSLRGIGGRVRCRPEDFLVEEITREGLVTNSDLTRVDRGDGRHTLAVLTKTSRDTIPTLNRIGKALGSSVSFAGIKDRRAVTSQLISIDRRLSQEELELGIPNVSVRLVGRSRWPLEAGELRGNRFTIVIRSLGEGSRDSLEGEWLPGYFGHQRFGTTRPNTHRIGRFLVKGDLEGAVRELVAEPYPNEPDHIRGMRSDLKSSWDIGEALRAFPRSLSYERMVLGRLMGSPGDSLGALRALPPNMLRLYVNSFQSYLFNHALSRRWEVHGLHSLEPGDYASPLDRWGSPARPIRVTAYNISTLRKVLSSGRGVSMVRVLGARTELKGIDRDIYDEILEKEGITLQGFENVVGRPFFGTLRFSAFRPMDFSISAAGPDDLTPGSMRQTLKTSLPKGCYATVLLRELMRPADPFLAGY